jgi:sterol desaturase/sphingolipid hydroxylase (fatty acid hydroxylase superfamily)
MKLYQSSIVRTIINKFKKPKSSDTPKIPLEEEEYKPNSGLFRRIFAADKIVLAILVITVVLVLMKVVGIISIPWLWVLSPLWGSWIVAVIGGILVFIIVELIYGFK